VVVGDQVFVPLFALNVSAGNGAFNDEERVLDMRAFALDYVRNELRITHDELAMVNVVGNSMEPHIHSGDVVLVDRRDKEISVEGPHLVRVDGALLVKNVQRRPGGFLRVSSRNEEYEPFEINVMSEQLHDFEVLGRVRWAGVTFR
jgi:phage repressor protein C with HTH and peptisase S24 domain